MNFEGFILSSTNQCTPALSSDVGRQHQKALIVDGEQQRCLYQAVNGGSDGPVSFNIRISPIMVLACIEEVASHS
jgi:hypothetical protein